ncbi:hypothetical protein BS17DRAFT_778160, partial [Gyrodon lividus]
MGANDIIQPRKPLSHNTVQKWIHEVTSSYSVPKAGLIIPDVPVSCSNGTCYPKKELWKDIVKHWPPEWTQGNNRMFTVKYITSSLSLQSNSLIHTSLM